MLTNSPEHLKLQVMGRKELAYRAACIWLSREVGFGAPLTSLRARCLQELKRPSQRRVMQKQWAKVWLEHHA